MSVFMISSQGRISFAFIMQFMRPLTVGLNHVCRSDKSNAVAKAVGLAVPVAPAYGAAEDVV
jgi:hypothetical protein